MHWLHRYQKAASSREIGSFAQYAPIRREKLAKGRGSAARGRMAAEKPHLAANGTRW
jgi:hypothetical protein